MGAPDVLAALRQAGISIRPDGVDRVVLAPKERLTDDLRAALRTYKPELLALLAEVDRLLARVAERYQWAPEDIEEARAGCSRDPVAHREMFVSWLTEPWPKEMLA